MTRNTPVACSLRPGLPPQAAIRSAASPLKGATPVARRSRFHGVSGLGHFSPVDSLGALLWRRIARWGFAASVLALAACGNNPPVPEWQMNAKGSADRAAEAWLSGDSRVEAAEFARARAEVSRTARPDLLARVELLRCAARVAALDFEPCTAFDALASDAAPAEQAYARYLKGDAQVADAPLLPEAHRGLVGATAAPDAALAGIADPMSRLVAA